MENNKVYCRKCGNLIDEDVNVCPVCNAEQKKSGSTGQKKVIKSKKEAVLCVVLVAVIVFGLTFIIVSTRNSKSEYKDNCVNLVSEMYEGAIIAEDMCSSIHDVWYNTIFMVDDSSTDMYTKSSWGSFNDDFNTSLDSLMTSGSYTGKVEKLKKNLENVSNKMDSMKNPPEEYRETYKKLNDFYTSYLKLVQLALSPSGSLTSYTEDYKDIDNDVAQKYKIAASEFE